MKFEELKAKIEETNPEIDDDTVNQVIKHVSEENKKQSISVDKVGIIAQLENELLNEPDWRKKASKAAKIINLKHFNHLDT